MLTFLKFVAAIIVAILILAAVAYFVIRWKLRSFFKGLKDLAAQFAAGGVPPFRIKLAKSRDYFGDDFEDSYNDAAAFRSKCREFEQLGFEPIDDFYAEEIMTSITFLKHRETASYGVVYEHPVAKVWGEVVRRYRDGHGVCYGQSANHLMDSPPNNEQHFFPDKSLKEIVELFWEQTSRENAALVADEDLAKLFEKVYADEMDWRIERNGPTEAEIRRIAERDGTDCTPEMVAGVQNQWRESISEFFSERVLRRYRKAENLSRSQWEQIEYRAVVIHERMQPLQLLSAFDDDYYEVDPEDLDDLDREERAEQDRWQRLQAEIETGLKSQSPQAVFRGLIKSENQADQFEYKGSVSKPLPADIWLRFEDPEDDDEGYDDEDDDDDED